MFYELPLHLVNKIIGFTLNGKTDNLNFVAMRSKIILIILLLVVVSINAFAVVDGGGGGTVAVPLDGGLLSILGAAGVAYFVARRKKKNADN
jgi:F0F1-type ATP synthase assembly protein I